MQIPSRLLEAISTDDGTLQELGIQVGKLYTDHGFPVDMALDRLPHSRQQKLSILTGALGWLVEHRRRSGATDVALERQRKANRIAIEHFIAGKEVGLY